MNEFMEKFQKGVQHVNVVSTVTKNELTKPNGTMINYDNYTIVYSGLIEP